MFEGVKVVELASVLAGPLVGSFFAELGASVIKIENKKTNGDVTRTWKLPEENKDIPFSAYYAAANYGKESILLDLSLKEDYTYVMQLIEDADILLVNFKPGDAQKLGLDYEKIQKRNPRIIYAELTGFGDQDVRTAFDVVLQAETGYMSINGERQALPLKMPLAMIDILAAHQLKEGILCAMLRRTNTNIGSKVSVSLYETAIASLANQATNFLMNGKVPEAIGSEHPNIAPYGDMFQSLNGDWFVLAVGTDRQFNELCISLGLDSIAHSEKYKTNSARVVHRNDMKKAIGEAIAIRSTLELESLFNRSHIPFGRVKNIREVFETDTAQSMVLEDDIEGYKARRVKTVAFRIS